MAGMGEDTLNSTDIWVSEHYWPDLAAELITTRSRRLARLDGTVATVVLPGEQTAFGLHLAAGPEDVRRALGRAGLVNASVGAGWLLAPGVPRHLAEFATHES